MNRHIGSGIIRYDPIRQGMRRRVDWWSIVHVDRELTRYYRWWVKKEKFIDLYEPSWDAHISIIRGEKPLPEYMHLWKKYNGIRISFEYEHDVFNEGFFWIIKVYSEELMNIRKEMNLPCNWPLHLTIGRTYY